LSEELTSKIIVPTKTAHALTRLILLVDLTRIKAYQIVYQTWYIFFILVLGKGLTDISTMPTPKHAVASAIGVELPQFSSFLCCLEQPPKRLVSLDFGYAT